MQAVNYFVPGFMLGMVAGIFIVGLYAPWFIAETTRHLDELETRYRELLEKARELENEDRGTV